MEGRSRLTPEVIKNLVRQALAEDIGNNDVTTEALIPDNMRIKAYLRTRQVCVVAGLPVFQEVFKELDTSLELRLLCGDGDSCQTGSTIAVISGAAKPILTGERTALNFIQRLSGIATLTTQYVKALENSRTRILDTRKTTPGLRALEKYAVVVGGGVNHRMGLYDRIMIKDNHLFLASHAIQGGIHQCVQLCRQKYPDLEIEVEVDTLEQLPKVLEAGVDYVLLDNMSTAEMIEATKLRDRAYSQTLLEASGGITLSRIPEIANIGLDFISVGAITHSYPAIDMGIDFNEPQSSALTQ